MTDEQINEIVQIDEAIRNCYLDAIERTDADREFREGRRNIAKWLEELKRYKENEHRQKEWIKALIAGQESLQNLIAEKDAEVERLKDDKKRLEKMMDNLSKELDAEKSRNF